MSNLKAQARPLSVDTIRRAAQRTRNALGYDDIPRVPMGHLLERKLPEIMPSFVLDVVSQKRMRDNEGLALPDRDYIALREDVFEGAYDGRGRDRFTVIHELGHLLLHESPNLVMARQTGARRIVRFCDPEWQSDVFAAEFLMDLRFMDGVETEDQIVDMFNVSRTAARFRLKTVMNLRRMEADEKK